MTLRSVLIPHDGSALARAVVDAVKPLVHPGLEVTLLAVDDGDGAASVQGALSEAERTLAGCAAVELRIVAGDDPAAAIVDAAATMQPDLVAMTTHGRTGTKRLARGSVADRVLRRCPAPLLMINPFMPNAGPFRSVLVPHDASETATRVVDALLPLARSFQSKITLLYVDQDDPTETPAQAKQRHATRVADITEWLAPARKRFEDAGIPVETRIEFGNVAEEILRLADSGQYDLLAMTSHGRSGPSRWLFGSVAQSVLRECRIPTLVRPTRA